MSRKVLLRHALAMVLMVAATSSTLAWEEDVHYLLTFYLAANAGFSRADADLVARGNQNLDDSAHAGAISSVMLVALTGDAGAAKSVRDKHFASDGPLPSPAARRVVSPNSLFARRQVDAALTSSSPEPYLIELGEALHPFQDSWSHQGVPDIPLGLRPNLSFAHPAARGGWRKHDADYTHLHVGDLLETAEETYKILLGYLDKYPRLRQRPAVSWATLKPKVEAFAKADTKGTKDRWAQQNIPSTGWVTAGGGAAAGGATTSAPAGGGRLGGRGGGLVRPASTVTIWTPSDTPDIGPRRDGLPSDAELSRLQSTVQLFLDSWFVDQDIEKAVTHIELDDLAQQFEGVRLDRIATLDWSRRFLTAQLVVDHERVNERGHVDPQHERYAELPVNPTSAGPFRTVSKPRLVVRPDQFIAANALGDSAVALILDAGGEVNDAIGLVWRRINNDWRIIRMLATPG
jgi:hypothetical protein